MISVGTILSSIISGLGGVLIFLFGGWDFWLQFLLIVMFLDIATGVMKSLYLKSEKTDSGAFSSKIFIRGMLRKGGCLAVIIVAVQIDAIFIQTGTPIDIAFFGSVRNAVILFFWLGEVVSILENCGEMGMKLPKPLMKFLDVLSDKLQEDEDEDEDKKN